VRACRAKVPHVRARHSLAIVIDGCMSAILRTRRRVWAALVNRVKKASSEIGHRDMKGGGHSRKHDAAYRPVGPKRDLGCRRPCRREARAGQATSLPDGWRFAYCNSPDSVSTCGVSPQWCNKNTSKGYVGHSFC